MATVGVPAQHPRILASERAVAEINPILMRLFGFRNKIKVVNRNIENSGRLLVRSTSHAVAVGAPQEEIHSP